MMPILAYWMLLPNPVFSPRVEFAPLTSPIEHFRVDSQLMSQSEIRAACRDRIDRDGRDPLQPCEGPCNPDSCLADRHRLRELQEWPRGLMAPKFSWDGRTTEALPGESCAERMLRREYSVAAAVVVPPVKALVNDEPRLIESNWDCIRIGFDCDYEFLHARFEFRRQLDSTFDGDRILDLAWPSRLSLRGIADDAINDSICPFPFTPMEWNLRFGIARY